MRTVFIHGEIEQYHSAKEALIERFGARSGDKAAGEDGADDRVLLTVLLDDKLVRDGLIARWSARDLERFLTETAPRKLILDDWSAVPGLLHRWVDFLAETDLPTSGHCPVSELHAVVDRATPEYLESMANPVEWGSAKFWSETMAEHGVDTDDDSAVERFFAAVDSGAVEVDEELVEAVEAREQLEPLPQPAYWLPPVPDLGGEDTDVSGAQVVAWMRGLLDWVGRGRKLAATGEVAGSELDELAADLGVADDGFQVGMLLEWATRAHLVRNTGERLVRTRISGPLLERPGVLCKRLWESFLLLEDVFLEEFEELEQLAVGESVFLHLVQGTLHVLHSRVDPLPLELLVSLTAESLLNEEGQEAVEIGTGERAALRDVLRRILRQWESLGVVRTSVDDRGETAALIGSAVPQDTEPDHTVVELMPFGRECARHHLEALGFVVPTVDDMARHSAEVMVLAVQDCSPRTGERVISAWFEARGRQAACAELTALLRTVDDPLVRLGALSVLEHADSDGVHAVRQLCADTIAGPAVRMWLQERVADGEVAVQPGDAVMFALDSMSVAAEEDVEAFLSELRESATTDQIALLEQIARVPHSRASSVLEVIAGQHPDSRVASVARRSLEKVRGT
ncbi:hypothetical protein DFQ14_101423 [Halopolyspora algeriensis]|uniref:Uncharacterized protein n=1 Tax=Halopolyspora algeriensis TaxID=1500506 RepID=A0A368W081_9ACTN|nr:hypothetical protein [Halopolyspora algeriensis]RCW47079.1 hypothetical protein DFQ14_101423 [Halopolyspora algeriensis]TQM48166.1 hypothetical protein FHU43_3128 [Halopolyspora algeriensis]